MASSKGLPAGRQGRIYSINISKGKGLPKQQVPHAYLRENHGIEGDIHAGGERQVSLLSWEAINTQENCPKIRKKGIKFKPGDFAENITTEGLNLTNLKIGDKIRIAGNIIIEVCQIGKECHNYCEIYKKLGNCIMPKQGIFAKVIKGGKIMPTDPIQLTF